MGLRTSHPAASGARSNRPSGECALMAPGGARHPAKGTLAMCDTGTLSEQPGEVGAASLTGRLKHGAVKWIPQGPASKWRSWDSHPERPAPGCQLRAHGDPCVLQPQLSPRAGGPCLSFLCRLLLSLHIYNSFLDSSPRQAGATCLAYIIS